jgi:ABC-type antimicrobial peptide transport system permease subunit
MLVMIRSDRGADSMEGVRKELASIDPNVAIFNVHSLAGQIADTMVYFRISEFVYGGIGAFGLVLSAIGLAGVTAYSVARRRKEIGIRMALGARKGLVIIGSVLGLLGASAISRVLAAVSSTLGPSFSSGARDPRLLIGAPLLLATLAMLACYLPARRSTQVDPLNALREE